MSDYERLLTDLCESKNCTDQDERYVTKTQLQRAYAGLLKCTRPLTNCIYEGCTNACDFYHDKSDPDVHVCMSSGKVHYCTATACQYTDVLEGSQITCRLTGRVWGVRMYTGGEREKGDSGGGGDASSCDQLSSTREGIIPQIIPAVVPLLFVQCEDAIAGKDTTTPAPTPKTKNRTKSKSKKTRSMQKDRLAIFNAVGSILEYLPQEFKDRKQYFVSVCIDVWDRFICNSKVYNLHPGKYLILYHCLVVFNQMRDGCYLTPPDKDPVVVSDDLMRCKFPDIKNLIIPINGTPRGVTLRQFTKTTKIFKYALLEQANAK